MIRTSIILAFLFLVSKTIAQSDTILLGKDTSTLTKPEKKVIYSAARKASIMSAILPGLGQAYNKKYWKIPIIYAGLGGFGYMFLTNNKRYQKIFNNIDFKSFKHKILDIFIFLYVHFSNMRTI